MTDRYTFGDGDRAAARLRRLAELYEATTSELILRGGCAGVAVAVDLGCGPGWSTRLLHDLLRPRRTLGLDGSARYVEQAQRLQGSGMEFAVHDVSAAPFPVVPDLLLCRFLLTHLHDTAGVLAAWAAASAPGARLLIHETESLTSPHPTLARYYELVASLQRAYAQHLDVGARLDGALAGSPWRVHDSRAVRLEMPAKAMAELHLANLRTWRDDDHARRAFDPLELDRLEGSLDRIVAGVEDAGVAVNVVRQVVAEREAEG
jgi:SAM-dependent methyltransferase